MSCDIWRIDFDGKAQGTDLRGGKKKKDGILKAVVKQLTHVYQSVDIQGQEPRLVLAVSPHEHLTCCLSIVDVQSVSIE